MFHKSVLLLWIAARMLHLLLLFFELLSFVLLDLVVLLFNETLVEGKLKLIPSRFCHLQRVLHLLLFVKLLFEFDLFLFSEILLCSLCSHVVKRVNSLNILVKRFTANSRRIAS